MTYEAEQEKERLYKQLYQKQKNETLEKIRSRYPFLYWTKKYHINTKGDEIDFKDMYYLLEIYKNWDTWTLLSCIKSVQVGFTELFIAASHYEAAQGLTVMYVLPKYEIRNRFVNNRVTRLHKKAQKYNELVRQASGMGGSHRTALSHFGLGGIAFVGSNVEDEFIEIPVDSGFIDELDRCNQKNILMLPDRLTASKYQFQREASNPTIEGFGIDDRFNQGTKGEWHIKCPHCNNWFTIDFFKHVVLETSPNLYKVIDKNFNPESGKKDTTSVICNKCNKPVDRLSRGEWVDEFPSREWKSLRISCLTSRYVNLTKKTKKWLEIGSNKTKQQLFFNSELGRAYTSDGAKVQKWMLNRIQRAYKFTNNPKTTEVKGVRSIGIDVGSELHYIVRERVREQGITVRRLIGCGGARNFSEIKQLIIDWDVKYAVIDANPELHEVATLKDACKVVYSCTFQRGLLDVVINKKERKVSIDRTAAMDAVKAAIDEERYILPANAEQIYEGWYYSHMQAPTRMLEDDEIQDTEKLRYVWREGSHPDHLFLAEAYCELADGMIPDVSVFEYMKREADRNDQEVAKDHDLTTMLADPFKNKERLEHLTPEIFATTIKKTHDPVVKGRVQSSIDGELLSVAENTLENFGGIDLQRYSTASGLNLTKAESFLLRNGYILKAGVYVKAESADE